MFWYVKNFPWYVKSFLAKILFFPVYKWFGKIGADKARYALVFPARVALLVSLFAIWVGNVTATDWGRVIAAVMVAAIVLPFSVSHIPKAVFRDVAKRYAGEWWVVVYLWALWATVMGSIVTQLPLGWSIATCVVVVPISYFVLNILLAWYDRNHWNTFYDMSTKGLFWLMVLITVGSIVFF